MMGMDGMQTPKVNIRQGLDLSEMPEKHRNVLLNKMAQASPPPALIDLSQHPWANRKADYYLYLYNTVDREFVVHRPPYFPSIRIAACPKDKPYVMAMKIPNLVNTRDINIETGEPRIDPQYGERFAMDIINPQNLGVDMWAQPSDDQRWIDGGTDDLSLRGVFWTKNDPPTDDELGRCRARLEKFYQAMVDRANRIAQDPQQPRQDITPECHTAADYFRLSPGWHLHMQSPTFCPNCGESIREGIDFHMSQAFGVCVIDWKGAVSAGIKKREDVPIEKRWWEDEGEVGEGGEVKRGPGRPRKNPE